MPDYRLYRLNPHNGHIDGVEEFHVATDDEAIDRALAATGPAPLELWQEGRKLLHVAAAPEMAASVARHEARLSGA